MPEFEWRMTPPKVKGNNLQVDGKCYVKRNGGSSVSHLKECYMGHQRKELCRCFTLVTLEKQQCLSRTSLPHMQICENVYVQVPTDATCNLHVTDVRSTQWVIKKPVCFISPG